jgi:hypothetical protein
MDEMDRTCPVPFEIPEEAMSLLRRAADLRLEKACDFRDWDDDRRAIVFHAARTVDIFHLGTPEALQLVELADNALRWTEPPSDRPTTRELSSCATARCARPGCPSTSKASHDPPRTAAASSSRSDPRRDAPARHHGGHAGGDGLPHANARGGGVIELADEKRGVRGAVEHFYKLTVDVGDAASADAIRQLLGHCGALTVHHSNGGGCPVPTEIDDDASRQLEKLLGRLRPRVQQSRPTVSTGGAKRPVALAA